MEGVFTDLISQFGYIGVWFLIFFENVFPPIPSELILPLSGFFTTTTSLTLPGVIIAATIGSITGAYILYGVGRLLSRERLMAFFGTRPMRLLGFKPEDISSAVDWFDRKGQVTVLICRCIPVVRSLISIPAGTAKMNVVRFSLYTLHRQDERRALLALHARGLGGLEHGALLAWRRRRQRMGDGDRAGRVGL